jgi:hypothetical protein
MPDTNKAQNLVPNININEVNNTQEFGKGTAVAASRFPPNRVAAIGSLKIDIKAANLIENPQPHLNLPPQPQ